jgi:hypothetical protein
MKFKYLIFLLQITFSLTAHSATQETEFRLIIDDWNDYLVKNPRIIVTEAIPSEIIDIIDEGHNITSILFGYSKDANDSYFQNKLSYLKKLAPSITRNRGESEHRDKRISHSGTLNLSGDINGYIDGHYINSHFDAEASYTNYEHYYREVTKFSNESLHRVVENLTANTTIPRLEQYIDALRQHWKNWNNTTLSMSTKGSSGVSREANLAYLELLNYHIRNSENLYKEIESIKQEHQRALKKWQDFRKYSAPLLSNYLKKNGKPLKIGANGSFSVENYSDSNNMILEFPTISEVVYYNLSSKNPPVDLPFKLIEW